ncbi:MAG: 50S ribosomal protein L17 [Opitutales bacterium]|nr:50S ribosomal protein L17 [Opitutales bacterium]
MRHLKHRHSLGRTKEHRAALMANLAAALLTHGKIQTTLAKAKALRPFVEKIITLAKRAHGASPERALHLRRLAMARVRDKDAVAKLFRERASEFTARTGGYTRIYKLGARIGDGAEMAVIQLIAASDEGYPKKGRKPAAKKAPATAAEAPAEEAPVAVEEAPAEVVAEETAAPEATEEKKD